MSRAFISVIFLLVFSVGSVFAQGGKKVDLGELGLSFRIPVGWQGGIQGEAYMLGHNSIPGLLIMTQNTTSSATELKNLAMQGVSSDGINLSPKGQFKLVSGDRVEGYYEGTFNGSQVRVYAIGLINKLGSGVNIYVVTETAKFTNSHVTEAKKLANSVRFSKRVDSKETRYWKNKLIGKKVKYMKVNTNSDYDGSYNSTTDSSTILLFDDGTFSYGSLAEGSAAGAYGSNSSIVQSKRKDRGRFQIYTVSGRTYLELKSESGTREYELTRNSKGNTFLNGTRYFVVSMD